MSTTLLFNPKKNIKKGGKTVAKNQKKTKSRNTAARRKFDWTKNLLLPAGAVLTGIVVTKAVKNYVMPKLTFIPVKTQALLAGTLVATGVYFARPYLKWATNIMAGALTVPLLEAGQSFLPGMLAGVVYDTQTRQISQQPALNGSRFAGSNNLGNVSTLNRKYKSRI